MMKEMEQKNRKKKKTRRFGKVSQKKNQKTKIYGHFDFPKKYVGFGELEKAMYYDVGWDWIGWIV